MTLSRLRRVAKLLHARVHVVLESAAAVQTDALAEASVPYRAKRTSAKPA